MIHFLYGEQYTGPKQSGCEDVREALKEGWGSLYSVPQEHEGRERSHPHAFRCQAGDFTFLPGFVTCPKCLAEHCPERV